MKKYAYLIVALLALTQYAKAQTTDFVRGGHIVYERKSQMQKSIQEFVNLHPQMKDKSTEIMAMYNAKYKPFQVTTYDLYFSGDKSYYTPQEKQPDTHQEYDQMFDLPGQDNRVFTDYATSKRLSTKSIFKSVLNVSDSIEKIKWRITDETREIAGFDCRRANGLIHDSVYVVAFYTTQIPSSMGPESFHGLPGMILGLSMPYLHSTWFATQVFPKADEAKASETQINKKNKTVNEKDFQSTIKTIANNVGGQDAGSYLIQYLNF
ncbi:MAG: GLPGLI family protein [Chitinophagaceae bacterium]